MKDASGPLPIPLHDLGRIVREAWVRWARLQPSPKPSWLVPYDELCEADRDADDMIGESVARAVMLAIAAREGSPVNDGEWTATPPDQPGLRYHWRDEHGERDILTVYRTGDGHLAAHNSKGLFGRLHEWGGEWWTVPIQEPPA